VLFTTVKTHFPGTDLFYEKTLTLSEALCGFKFAVPHLDGRQLLVASNEGDIVKPGCFKAVYDEGMPTWQRPQDKGRLFIHFDVAFPEPGDLSDKETAALATLLPARPTLEVDLEACQEVSVSDVDMEQELRRQKERQMEEEEDEDPRGGRVQCAQQVRRAPPLPTSGCPLSRAPQRLLWGEKEAC
jgi:DnaJ family protein A protein 2